MGQTIRIAQITDCHLPGDKTENYRGINPYKTLMDLMPAVERFSPDLILATGDLSEDASGAAYWALQAIFDKLAVPVLALPGNHDDPQLLAEIFVGSPVDDIAVTEHGDWQIIRLNSCLKGMPDGRLSEQLLGQLKQLIQIEPKRPRLVALHHQPVPVNSPWIDKYRLLEPQAFLNLVEQAATIKAVVWGHVHQAFETQLGSALMMSAPSSATNGLPGMQEFTADVLGPACRWLELDTNGSVRSGIITA